MKFAPALHFLLAAAVFAGCGKPRPGGGPPADAPVQAVVALVRSEEVADTLRAAAEVEAAESVRLLSEVDATLVEARVEDGATVADGDVLYRFDDLKFAAAVTQAVARLTLARHELERARRLQAENTIPQADLDRTEAEFRSAEAALALASDNAADTVVRAPIAGVLEDRPVTQGQFCARGQDLGRLIQLDPLDLSFSLPERDAGRVRPGLAVAFRGVAVPEAAFKGEITYLAPALDAASRSLRVKARLANPGGRLRPGMFGAVEVELSRRAGVVRIPETALSLHRDQARVVVMNDEGRAEFREVRTGARGDGVVEIVQGLQPGERVVLEGFQKMRPGAAILVSPKSEAFGVNPAPAGSAGDTAAPAAGTLPGAGGKR